MLAATLAVLVLVTAAQPGPPPQRWAVALKSPARACPAIHRGMVFVGLDDGRVVRLDPTSGQIVWSLATGGPVRSALAVADDGTVFVGSDSGLVHAIDSRTGREVWRFSTGGAVRGGPTLGPSGQVLVGSADNLIYALEPASGRLLWKTRMGGPIEAAPAVGPDGIVAIAAQDGWLRTLDPETGAERWAVEVGGLPTGSPVFDRFGRVIYAGSGRIVRIEPGNPPVLTTLRVFEGYCRGGVALTLDDVAIWGLAGTQRDRVFALDGASNDFKTLWTLPAGSVATIQAAPALGPNGEAYFGTTRGDVVAIDSRGQKLWTVGNAESAAIEVPPILGDGLLVIATTGGMVRAFGVEGTWPTLGQNSRRLGRAEGPFFLPGERIAEKPARAGPRPPEIEPVGSAHYQEGARDVGGVYAVHPGRIRIQWFDSEKEPQPVGPPLEVRVAAVPIQRIEMGEEVPRPRNAAPDPGAPEIRPVAVDGSLGDRVSDALLWRPGEKRLLAVKPGLWELQWFSRIHSPIPVRIRVEWPVDPARYQLHVMGTPEVDLRKGSGLGLAQILHQDSAAGATLSAKGFHATGAGRTLMGLASGDVLGSSPDLRLVFVRSIAWDDPASFLGEFPAPIGRAIDPPAGRHDPATGSPWVFFPRARICDEESLGFYSFANRAGPIFPVNTDEAAQPDDDLVLVFYQATARARRTGQGAKLAAFPGWSASDQFYGSGGRRGDVDARVPAAWPVSSARYRAEWPEPKPGSADPRDPGRIVLARVDDLGRLDPAVFADPKIYTQNDRARTGFNPNDEHAYLDGSSVQAIRDDLETPGGSRPFVLVTYRDRTDGNRPRIKVFQVRATDETHRFRYTAQAGDQIQSPPPLRRYPLGTRVGDPVVQGPGLIDRKGTLHAYAAGDTDDAPAVIVARHFYVAKADFYFPEELYPEGRKPKVGDSVPFLERRGWLDRREAQPGQEIPRELDRPCDVIFDVAWPEVCPKLHLGDTLTKPHDGLPDVLSDKSVAVVYQQAERQGRERSVELIDFAAAFTANLDLLPGDLQSPRSVAEGPRIFFPELPPHLRRRFFFDPTAQKLGFRGMRLNVLGHEAEPAEDGWVLLNLLGRDDRSRYLDPLSNDPQFRRALDALGLAASEPKRLAGDDPATGRALTAGLGRSTGYITLAFGNSRKLNDPGDIVRLQVIKVVAPREPGRVLVIPSEDPFSEDVALRHSGDFAGKPENYLFDWRIAPDEEVSNDPANWLPLVATEEKMRGADAILLDATGGRSLLVLRDSRVACRYRPADQSEGWTQWTDWQLVEGWVKRVRRGINLFESRVASLRDQPPPLAVSAIQQSGPRYRGAVPLTLDATRDFKLIEIYETIYRRARKLSIEGSPAVDDTKTNQTLQLAAGMLADLYMILGQEAVADAADPTVALSPSRTAQAQQLERMGSGFCFMNQVPSLLDEELALLRGIDGKTSGATRFNQAPVFNRLRWNLTQDLGEVFYVANYQISDRNLTPPRDLTKSRTPAEVAAELYPQGHGDAWGHFLTAQKAYYTLLRSPNFTWDARPENVLVKGEKVTVDYLDERKFARAAAAKARTGTQVVGLTDRLWPGPSGASFRKLEDDDHDRAWGPADWACRSGQGAYFDWVLGNAMLPSAPDEPRSQLSGLERIDRSTVPELAEVRSDSLAIQAEIDRIDAGLNPLGLPDRAVSFDIDPRLLDLGKTHFEQVHARAVEATRVAAGLLDVASSASRERRGAGEDLRPFVEASTRQEAEFKGRLVEVYGTPLTTDIGAGKLYPEGYDGPDLHNYDRAQKTEFLDVPATTLKRTVKLRTVADPLVDSTKPPTPAGERLVELDLLPGGFAAKIETDPNAKRLVTGEIQLARVDLLQAAAMLAAAVDEYGALLDRIDDQAGLLRLRRAITAQQVEIRSRSGTQARSLNDEIHASRVRHQVATRISKLIQEAASASVETLPRVVGFIAGMASGPIIDATAPARGGIKYASMVARDASDILADVEEVRTLDAGLERDRVLAQAEFDLFVAGNPLPDAAELAALKDLIRQEPVQRLQLAARRAGVEQSAGRLSAILARGTRLQDERTRFRYQVASTIRDARYRDVAFRVAETEPIRRYRAQFDLAAAYTYLAATAYEFETNLGDGDPQNPRSAFFERIIRARNIGDFLGERPLPGSGTLTGVLNDLEQSFNGVRARLRFANPQAESKMFSLRRHLFRIGVGPGADGEDDRWRDELLRHRVDDLKSLSDLTQGCKNLPGGPGLVIPFSSRPDPTQTTNYFGRSVVAGDVLLGQALSETKIRSLAVRFTGFQAAGPRGLVATPQVYLLPAGVDLFRVPGQPLPGEPVAIRAWNVIDCDIPEPFHMAGIPLSETRWSPWTDFRRHRRHNSFDADHDAPPLAGKTSPTDTQLVGRSVYNTRWLLVIPAQFLLGKDHEAALDRLIGSAEDPGVSDIQLLIRTYSVPGGG